MKNLTILLPVKDRPYFTLRVMRYFDYINCPYRVIIGDGSCDERVSTLLSLYRFNNLVFTYKRYDADTSYKKFLEKVDDMISHVTTDYVAWACDDDFMNFEELETGLAFLSRNKDYSFYSGKVVNFELRGGSPEKGEGSLVLGSDVYSMRESIDGDLKERFGNFNSLRSWDFGIHKTPDLKKIFSVCIAAEVSHYYDMDVVAKCIILLSGKVYTSYKVGVLRQHNTPDSAGSLIPIKNDSLGFFKEFDFPSFIEREATLLLKSAISEERLCLDVTNIFLLQIIHFYNDKIRKSYHISVQPFYLVSLIKILHWIRKILGSAGSLGQQSKTIYSNPYNISESLYQCVLLFCSRRG
jgi:glycosyltransferase domain-containing protein